MKKLFAPLILLIVFTSSAFAQNFADLDKSPLDVSYFPNGFPHDRKPGDKAVIKITYSRPQKNGRDVFGALVPYGKVWRLGANEASEIKVYQDIQLNGKTLKAGTYSLFAIPEAKKWTIIISSDLDYWGAYSYNEKNDVLRITTTVSESDKSLENFSIHCMSDGKNKGVISFAWDKTIASLPFTY